MPRSQSQIRSDNAARDRCHALIGRVVKTFTGKRDATSIVQRIQFNHAKTVTGDSTMLTYLWGRGLAIEVRAAMAEWGVVETPEEEAPQLALFPEGERKLVKRIGRARIWVPSLQEHVSYHKLSAAQLREAADYYVAHGMGEVRLGENLRLLAAMREPPQQRAA